MNSEGCYESDYMRVTRGDIWSPDFHIIVIPVNIGWTKTGYNVMGRGVAKQASELYPGLAKWYGSKCRSFMIHTPCLRYDRLILFPVKPLNVLAPYLSWQGKANLSLIEKSTKDLAEFPDKEIALPLVGCGNGRLSESDVLPILNMYLDDRFVLVRTVI